MNRRILLVGLVLAGFTHAVDPAHADGGSGNSGSGSNNSGSSGGSGNSGSGSSGSSGSSNSGSSGNSGPGNSNRDENDDDGHDSGSEDWNQAADAVERGDIAPLQSILKIALSNTPGKVIGVKLNRRGATYAYRVKILAATGRKVELSIEARTRIVTKVK
jgi:hypothetical protein